MLEPTPGTAVERSPKNWRALLCEQHRGWLLPDTEVGKYNRYAPFTFQAWVMMILFFTLLLSVTNHVLNSVQTILCAATMW